MSVIQPWFMILDYSCVLDSLHETFIKNADVILDMTYGYVQFKKIMFFNTGYAFLHCKKG